MVSPYSVAASQRLFVRKASEVALLEQHHLTLALFFKAVYIRALPYDFDRFLAILATVADWNIANPFEMEIDQNLMTLAIHSMPMRA